MNDFIAASVIFDGRPYLAAALYEDRVLTELSVEPDDRSHPSLVGRIYRGYVEKVVKNTGGAFIRIGKMTAFLPGTKDSQVRGSQPVTVMVTKDAAGVKDPVVTENLHLAGRYCVISGKPGRIAFSSKLSEEEKAVLKKWIPHDYGSRFHILMRTNAARAIKSDVLNEVDRLMEEMQRILSSAGKASSGDLLYVPEPFYVTMLRDLYVHPDRVFTDIPAAELRIAPFAGAQGDAPVLHEKGELSLAGLYNLSRDLGRSTSKKVFLKSGAYLVIEQTEAFVSVDVNSGKCERGRIPEEMYRRVNLEAAEELARQMRLRNLSGMILVDFISMKNEDHIDELFHVMKKLVKRDHMKTEVVDITPLGIMEIVRQKMKKPLAEILGLC